MRGAEPTPEHARRRLVADVGGTNVRFALADAGELRHTRAYRTARFASFDDALHSYLGELGGPRVGSCAIGAAGPVDGGSVRLTNCDWSISAERIAARLAGAEVAVVNDLEAVAAALPVLAPADTLVLGRAPIRRDETRSMLALNIGTGFGAATVIHRGGQWWTVPSEAGHMTLAAATMREGRWIAPDASIEHVLSGAGVARLFAVLTGTPRDAFAALPASPRLADAEREAVEALSSLIGRVAGDLVLATAAWGGVYLCGSVALAWAAIADQDVFRAAFERKGAMRERMAGVATAVIVRADVALAGLAALVIPAAGDIGSRPHDAPSRADAAGRGRQP